MFSAPRFMFMQVNKRCNLRCQHCSFWTYNDDDKPNYLSRERTYEIMGEFAQMNPRGTIVICGGEPMLDLHDYFALNGEARRLGLTVMSVVNGTRIRAPKMAERMIDEGPQEISISLNSHRPELHDSTRGIPGAFDKAVRALRLLVDARKRRPGSTTKIYAMGLIFDENVRDLEDFYDFVLNDVGADKLKLNFLQPSFGESAPVDEFFEKHHRVDPDELVAVIRKCNARFNLGLNPAWLGNVRMYQQSLAGLPDAARGWQSEFPTRDHICNTYERNIMVDHYGTARLCFSNGYRGLTLERPGDLAKFWREADDIRAEMRNCNRFCGISHSVRREASTLAGAARVARDAELAQAEAAGPVG